MELHECLAAMKRRLWFVAALTAVAVITSWAVSQFLLVKVYESAATILVSRPAAQTRDAGSQKQGILLNSNEIQVFYDLAESESVDGDILRRLNLDIPVKEIKKQISVDANFDTGIIKVSARANTSGQAHAITQAFIQSLEEQSEKLAMQAEIKIIDAPKFSLQPVNPNIPLNMLLSATGGMLAGFLISIYMESRRRCEDEFRLRDKFPLIQLLGCLPKMKRKGSSARPVLLQSGGGFPGEAMNVIKTNLMYLLERDALKTVLLASPLHGEGTTTLAFNIAVSVAQMKKRVLLVDCNVQNPAMYKISCMYNTTMSARLLNGDAEQEYVAHSIPSLGIDFVSDFVPSKYRDKGNADCWIGSFLADAKRNYDLILIDTPPLLLHADALMLSRLVQGVIVVADYNRMAAPLLQKSVDKLKQMSVNILGIAINKIPPAKMCYLI